LKNVQVNGWDPTRLITTLAQTSLSILPTKNDFLEPGPYGNSDPRTSPIAWPKFKKTYDGEECSSICII